MAAVVDRWPKPPAVTCGEAIPPGGRGSPTRFSDNRKSLKGRPPFVSRPEGAPSFRVLCERVDLSIEFEQNQSTMPGKLCACNPTLAKNARMGHPPR